MNLFDCVKITVICLIHWLRYIAFMFTSIALQHAVARLGYIQGFYNTNPFKPYLIRGPCTECVGLLLFLAGYY